MAVFNCVKCFREVQLDDNNLLLGLLALMNVLKGPSQIIFNGSGPDKSILILVHQRYNNGLQPFSQEFGDE
jgi:hypothetical protein